METASKTEDRGFQCFNANISTTTLYMNEINTLIKTKKIRNPQTARSNYRLFTISLLNIKTDMKYQREAEGPKLPPAISSLGAGSSTGRSAHSPPLC